MVRLVFPLLLLSLIALVVYRMGVSKAWAERRLPNSAPRPARRTRRAEALVLLLLGGAVFVVCASTLGAGSRLLRHETVPLSECLGYFVATALALLGVPASAAITAVWGRTRTGVLLLAGVLSVYAVYLHVGDVSRWSLTNGVAPRQTHRAESILELSFVQDVGGFQFRYEGADLSMNGVPLGKTPLRMTLGEFEKRVPRWTAPPEPADTPTSLTTPAYSPRFQHSRTFPLWIKLHLPVAGTVVDTGEAAGEYADYYAQIGLDGEPGYSAQGYGASGGPGYFGLTARVVIPSAQARLERLLTQARARDYDVDAAWMESLNRFGEPAWDLVAHLALKEPGFERVRQRRIASLFGLDQLTTPEAAWAFLEKTMREADSAGTYETLASAGQAIALVAPRLNADRLCRLAEATIPLYDFTNVAWSRVDGRMEFGSTGLRKVGATTTYTSGRFGGMESFGKGPRTFPPSAFVLAHAVWTVEQLLRDRKPDEPTVFQVRLVPQLLRWQYGNQTALRVAAALGGPGVRQYLLRHNWRAVIDPRGSNWEDRLYSMGETNKWLYLLTVLHGEAGREFRREHRDQVLQMAESIAQPRDLREEEDRLDFLFLDPDMAGESPAMRFWPRYRTMVVGKSYDLLTSELRYLVRMEPLATLDMYAQAWRDTRQKESNWSPVGEAGTLVKETASLPVARRIEILRTALSEVESDLKAQPDPDDRSNQSRSVLESARGELHSQLLLAGDPEEMQNLLPELRGRDAAQRIEALTGWLAHERPDHPLVALLAQNSDAALRKIALAPIVAYPVRANRALLPALLADPDPGVQQAANEAQAALEELAK